MGLHKDIKKIPTDYLGEELSLSADPFKSWIGGKTEQLIDLTDDPKFWEPNVYQDYSGPISQYLDNRFLEEMGDPFERGVGKQSSLLFPKK